MMLAHAALAAAAMVLAGVRWLRVAQREHYLPGAASRFAWRWWTLPRNAVPAAVAVLATASSVVPGWEWIAVAVPVIVAAGPMGLGLRGRSGPLAWTPRLRRMAVVAAVVGAGLLAGAVAVRSFSLVAVAVIGAPVWVDAAAALLAPLERRAGERWVRAAASTLAGSGARVVAVTGSYGKTTTKLMIAHLLGGTMPTVASPASFNNRMGLARAINEGLAPGTAVFVAEMGTYGPGEIAELCSWMPPDVAAITAIGPVHLERMGSEEAIAAAKREILARARVGVLNVDHPLLAAIADEEEGRREVTRCSTVDRAATVHADPATGRVTAHGQTVGTFDPGAAHAGNVAVAVGAALAAGAPPGAIGPRLASLPVAPHRQTVAVGSGGFSIIDDTFNANPAGAAAALARLGGLEAARRVVVTPGMVELGRRQFDENRVLGAESARVAGEVVIVGETNRRALVEGASAVEGASVIVVATREDAVAWVRENLSAGDAVLYENDLPDHYP